MKLIMQEITDSRIWDKFILSYGPYALFQSWSWGDVIAKTGRAYWRLGWYERDSLVAVALIEKVPARRGAFLHVRHGPILSIPHKKYWSVILEGLRDLAKKERVLFVRISPQIEDAGPTQRILTHLGGRPAPIHAMDAEYCWVLDLRKPEDVLLSEMRKTTRYEIKRAQKLGVTVTSSTRPEDLSSFEKLYTVTSARHQFVRHTGIREEFEVFCQKGNAVLFTGSVDNAVLASAIILFWGTEAIYHHGASLSGKIPASYLLQWEAIREAKRRGCSVYNFWGIAPSDSPNHPWNGITTFKTGFGGGEMKFMHALDFPVSVMYVIPHTIETIRKRMKGY